MSQAHHRLAAHFYAASNNGRRPTRDTQLVIFLQRLGRAEVEKFHAPLFATRFKDTNQRMTKTKIRFIKSDVAAVDAWWEMTGVKGPEGQDIPLRRGLLNFVMTKEGEKWLITVMHNMDLPASP